MSKNKQTATLAGGCFWCLEAVYENVIGVESVESGYIGGNSTQTNYKEVSRGTTGHAEAVHFQFDSESIAFKDLLRIFFTIHDPTTLNRQGADVGTQYRSAIFTHDDQQINDVKEIIQEITEAKIWNDPIITEVTPFDQFFKAEDYHQGYYANNSSQPYCRAVVEPKVAKFRSKFQEFLKE